MKAETAAALKNAADQLGKECEILPTYSGRGMYGKTTHALSVDRIMDVAAFAAQAVATHYELTRDDADETAAPYNPDAAQELIEDLSDLRTDNLELGFVVY